MKKFLSIVALSATFLLAGCSDFFVDVTAVHNGLVDRMNANLAAEEAFYKAYFDIQDGDKTEDLVADYETFKSAFADLDQYFADTKFASSQQVFVEEYNASYKDSVQKYVDRAGEFVADVKDKTFVLADAEPYFEEIDAFAQDFIEVHNHLISTINEQADY